MTRPLIPLAEIQAHLATLVLDAEGKSVLPNCRYILVLKGFEGDPQYLQMAGTHANQEEFASVFSGAVIRQTPRQFKNYVPFITARPVSSILT